MHRERFHFEWVLGVGRAQSAHAAGRGEAAKRAGLHRPYFKNGGASQLDTFDPKPDAPSDIKGSFGSVPTSVLEIHFSGLLPRTAKSLNRFAVIRSMHSDEAIHERARQYIFSGTKPRNDLLQPSYGAVISKGARSAKRTASVRCDS